MSKLFQKGFSLLELLIAIFIIAVLASIAFPKYAKFVARCKRAEAITMLRGAHTAQTSYFAGNDHYLQVCGPGTIQCFVANSPAAENHESLGLNQFGAGGTASTSQGYYYVWFFKNESTTLSYEFHMYGDLFRTHPNEDRLVVGMGDANKLPACVLAGVAEPGVPFIWMDDILEKTNC